MSASPFAKAWCRAHLEVVCIVLALGGIAWVVGFAVHIIREIVGL